jgi:hypothetical protein
MFFLKPSRVSHAGRDLTVVAPASLDVRAECPGLTDVAVLDRSSDGALKSLDGLKVDAWPIPALLASVFL